MRGHHRGGHGRRGPDMGHGRGHGPGFGRGHGPEEKIGRMLGQGDLRYVILSFIEAKPRHGYELIKCLEDHSSGAYSPSPGVIYPTLTFLEEGGYATASMDQNKKVYAITPEGRVLMEENKEFLDLILKRLSEVGERMSRLKHMMGREEMHEVGREDKSSIRRSMHALKSELFSLTDASKDKKNLVAAILDRAIEEIRKLKD